MGDYILIFVVLEQCLVFYTLPMVEFKMMNFIDSSRVMRFTNIQVDQLPMVGNFTLEM